MRSSLFLLILFVASTLAACGDDTDTSTGGGGEGGTGAAGGSGGAGGGGGSPEGGGGGDIGEPFECGDERMCEGDGVCIIEPNEPECENLEKGEDECPKGTTMTNCGGAGIPCCCGPTPDPDYRCASAEACDGAPTCECADPCMDGDVCTEILGADRTLQCEPPPKP